ncbi:class II aldolase/adducin family protein [Acidobacterium sp. S8]|uniref:class II aldolase/adducin family protein n=1 Tax=Acidobacterium sp. S8 TaxID=1641854 RepID=UPI00131E6BBF|nr:class II aldolase/adducin family protein [Acidobacterium sp. S8]
MQTQLEEQLVEGCRRLARKEFLNNSADSFSLRIPGQAQMMLISGSEDWRQAEPADIRVIHFSAKDDLSMLHAWIYQERSDVGAIAITCPKWVRLLANSGSPLPPIFDEQVRHIGSSGFLKSDEPMREECVRQMFRRGGNAVLFGERLLCLGMTCDRVLFNTELYEKCAQAYVIARVCKGRISHIPFWVRMIANRRLLKDEATAAASYRDGRVPQEITAY